jgi:hypothetical protein
MMKGREADVDKEESAERAVETKGEKATKV